MAENESMEGKDLALEEKKEFETKVLQAIEKLKKGETTVSMEGLEVTSYGEQFTLKLKGITFGIIDKKCNFTYNKENFVKIKETLKQEGKTLEELGLPDLEQAIDLDEQAKKQQEKEQIKDNKGNEENSEGQNEEQQENEGPELPENKQTEKIAKKYGINAGDVIHFSKTKKITSRETFKQLAGWAKDYSDIYVLPGEDGYSKKIIGIKDGKEEEIEGANQYVNGKNPNVKIKLIDKDKVREIRPLAMYKINDDRTAIAFARNEHGQTEAYFCRREGGKNQEFVGSVMPQAEGKNVRQADPETRDIMDYRSKSNNDLINTSDLADREQDLEDRGMPSEKPGVQPDEISGSSEQNRDRNIDYIIEDLMKRDGIKDKMTSPPGYYESKAEKVLKLMEENYKITYEEAVAKVNSRTQREPGGTTPGEKRDRRE